MQVWNVLYVARWKYRTQKIAKNSPSGHHRPICRATSLHLRHVSTVGKKLVKQQCLPPHVLTIWWTLGPLTAEISLPVWGTPANFNLFCVLAALLHGTLVVGVSQTLRHWTEGATYIRQGSHHVGHWLTFLVSFNAQFLFFFLLICRAFSWSEVLCELFLWPPCIADADIICCSSGFFFLSSFFPHLFSAIADWMSTILPHMMWP